MLFYPHHETHDDIGQVVVMPQYRGKWLLARHVNRRSLAFPSDVLRDGEDALAAADRVLREECGGLVFTLWPVAVYGYLFGQDKRYGQLFYAYVEGLIQEAPYARADHSFFDEETEGMSGSSPQSLFLEQVERWLLDRCTTLYCVPADLDDFGLISDSGHNRPSGQGAAFASARSILASLGVRFPTAVAPDAVATALGAAMESHYVDRVLCFPDPGLEAVLLPFSKSRRLALEASTWLGREGAVVFKAQGFAALRELLGIENGCSALLGLQEDMLTALRSGCDGLLPMEDPGLDPKYLMPDELRTLAEKARRKSARQRGAGRQTGEKTLGLLRLDFLEDVLIGADIE